MTYVAIFISMFVLIFCLLPFNFIICKDLYKILELKNTASANEIKKQYRKLTLKYHPDRNPGNNEAKDKFTAVAEANEILSDPKKRRLYDRGGMEAVKNHVDQQQQGGGFDPFGGMFGRYQYYL